jgi:hypothetical protein
VGVGVGAVQFFPTYQFVKLGHRVELSPEALFSMRWPLRHIVTLWLPDFWGDAIRYDYRSVANFAETAAYFGVAPALLCLISPLVNRQRHNWLAVSLLVLILLVVGGTPLLKVAARIPGFRYFRLSRLAGLLAFPGATMAAIAADTLARQRRARTTWRGLGIALGLIVLITGWIVGADVSDLREHWAIIRADLTRTLLLISLATLALVVMIRRPRLGLAGLALLTFVDLYQWGEPFNPIHSTDILYPQNEVVDVLRQDDSLYRVLPLRSQWIIFGPNVLSVFDIAEIGGYTSLTVQRYQELIKAIGPDVTTGHTLIVWEHFHPLYSMLNVKYVLSAHDLPTIVELARYEGCTRQTEPLVDGEYFEQTFTTSQVGLNRIDLALAHVGQVGDQPVRLRVWRGNAEGEIIADITGPAGELPDRDFGVFFFAPVSDSVGDRFTWRIEAPGAAPDATVAVCLANDASEETASFVAYGALLQQIDQRQGVWIYQNHNVLPRAYVVHHTEVAPGGQDLAVLQSPQFNPYRTVILEAPLPAEQAASLSPTPVRSQAQAAVARYTAHRVDVEVQTPAPGILVLSDVYYPGWQVWINGERAQLLQVNHALRGVYLPAGDHSVAFIFRPTVFYVGLGTTGVTTLAIVVVVVWMLRNQRLTPSHQARKENVDD